MLINMAKNKKVTMKSILVTCVIGVFIGFSLAGYNYYKKWKSRDEQINAIISHLPVTMEGTGDKWIKFIIDDDNHVYTMVIIANDYKDSNYSFTQKLDRFDYIKNRACQDDIYYKYFYRELMNGASVVFDIQDNTGKTVHTIKLSSTSCSKF